MEKPPKFVVQSKSGFVLSLEEVHESIHEVVIQSE